MKERPILFSGPMVRAILDGTKTQTRRVVNIKKHCGASETHESRGAWICENGLWRSSAGQWNVWSEPCACPYGKTGDRLWVRETWTEVTTPCRAEDRLDFGRHRICVVYRADSPGEILDGTWKPSIHMRRWASRIMLEVTGVRVERLQDISEADALAEGCPEWAYDTRMKDRYPARAPGLPRHWYAQLWDQINGERAWDANPWVWVVEFRKLEGGAA